MITSSHDNIYSTHSLTINGGLALRTAVFWRTVGHILGTSVISIRRTPSVEQEGDTSRPTTLNGRNCRSTQHIDTAHTIGDSINALKNVDHTPPNMDFPRHWKTFRQKTRTLHHAGNLNRTIYTAMHTARRHINNSSNKIKWSKTAIP